MPFPGLRAAAAQTLQHSALIPQHCARELLCVHKLALLQFFYIKAVERIVPDATKRQCPQIKLQQPSYRTKEIKGEALEDSSLRSKSALSTTQKSTTIC
jgi:hypothetical protein